jgi:alanine racemase
VSSGLHELRISWGAISANAEVLADRGITIADLRADAYGHQLVSSAAAVLEGGATSLLVSSEADAAALDRAGIIAPVIREYGGPTMGGALYGLDGVLRPAMRISARVVGIKTIQPGDGVSYGYTYRAPVRTNLALVALGYADGLDRWASNRGTVLLSGASRLIAGRVAMNVHVLELGDDTAAVGDEAVLFGDPAAGEPSVVDWASSIGASPAAVTSVFGARLRAVAR